MGWKAVKEHYQIKHIAHVVDGHFAIGSAYISEMIVIDGNGAFLKKYDSMNADITRYKKEIGESPETFARLFAEPDTFTASIPVFTWDGDKVLELLCEETGWPNCTHDGRIMYQNQFFTDKDKAIAWAKKDAEAWLKNAKEVVKFQRNKLAEALGAAARAAKALESLEAQYPAIRDTEKGGSTHG